MSSETTQATNLFSLSKETAQVIRRLMVEENATKGGIRLKVVSGGCNGLGYQMTFVEEPLVQDEVIEVEGLRFFIPTFALGYFEGGELKVDTAANPVEVYFRPADFQPCQCH